MSDHGRTIELLTDQRDDLAYQADDLRFELKACRKDIGTLQDERNMLKDELNERQDEIEKLYRDKLDLELEIEDLNEHIARLTKSPIFDYEVGFPRLKQLDVDVEGELWRCYRRHTPPHLVIAWVFTGECMDSYVRAYDNGISVEINEEFNLEYLQPVIDKAKEVSAMLASERAGYDLVKGV